MRHARTIMCCCLFAFAAGCGDPDAAGVPVTTVGNSVAIASVPNSSVSPSTTPSTSDTTIAAVDGGLAVAEPGEFVIPYERRFGGVLELDSAGCWRLGNGEVSGLIVFPPGSSIRIDRAEVVTPDGLVLRSGDRVSGVGGAFSAYEVPGGDGGRWAGRIEECGSKFGVFAAMTIRQRFMASAEEAAALVDGLTGAEFVTDFGCGYGFVTSSADELVSLRLRWNEQAPSPGPMTFPTESISAEVVVGDDQFLNWCDDVGDWYEPLVDGSGNRTFAVTGGGFAMPPFDLADACSGLALTIVVDDLTVETPTGSVVLDPIEITNDAFGCFAG